MSKTLEKIIKIAESKGRVQGYGNIINILTLIDITNPIMTNTIETILDEVKILMEKEINEY